MLKQICHVESLQKFVREADHSFYSILLDILIPDVLRPVPSSLTLVLRNFAKNLSDWIDMAMSDLAPGMIRAKKMAASGFSQLLRRYTGLNHLAQAARAVLQNRGLVNRMSDDLSKVDFNLIQDQAVWVCQCNGTLVFQLQQFIQKLFRQHKTIEQWSECIDDITTYVLHDHSTDADTFRMAARRFIVTWSFYRLV